MKEKIYHHDEFDIFFCCDEEGKREAFRAEFNVPGDLAYFNPAIALEAKTEATNAIIGMSIARWGRGEYVIMRSDYVIEAFRCRIFPLEFLLSGES